MRHCGGTRGGVPALTSAGNKLDIEMVEAAGVEPASENVTGQETTCLFAFMPQALGVAALPKTFATAAQNGQETVAASLRS